MDIVGTHGVSWELLRTSGSLGDFLGLLRSPWVSRGFFGTLCDPWGVLGESFGTPRGNLKNSLGLARTPGDCFGLLGSSWNSYRLLDTPGDILWTLGESTRLLRSPWDPMGILESSEDS